MELLADVSLLWQNVDIHKVRRFILTFPVLANVFEDVHKQKRLVCLASGRDQLFDVNKRSAVCSVADCFGLFPTDCLVCGLVVYF